MGACLDTGAQRSVCGIGQARAYYKLYHGSLTKGGSTSRFKFGKQLAQSIGSIRVELPVEKSTHISVTVDVIQMDIPLIIGLDILRPCKLSVNYVDNTLHYCNEGVTQPLTYKHGHVFYEWDTSEMFFTRQELTWLHLHFMHPSSERLFYLIARVNPTKATPSVKELINSITNACSSCQSFKSAPLRFKPSVPKDHLIFKHTISVDFVCRNERPVLHVIDENTKFRNACFLKSKSSADFGTRLWDAGRASTSDSH